MAMGAGTVLLIVVVVLLLIVVGLVVWASRAVPQVRF